MEQIVSVLLPVYNAENYISEAIKSILNQTFSKFELIIINDSSTDESLNIIKSFRDSRIRLLNNERNMQLSNTLNQGIRISKGKYIARMDADDISFPLRLEKQLEYMEKNIDVIMCGSKAKLIGTAIPRVRSVLTNNELIKCQLLFESPIIHPSVMFRSEDFKKNNFFYDPFYEKCEDFELWTRISKIFKIENLNEILMGYRLTQGSQSRPSFETCSVINNVIIKQLSMLNIIPTTEEINYHKNIINNKNFPIEEVLAIEKWLLNLISMNYREKIYPQKSFEYIIVNRWRALCMTYLSLDVLEIYNKSELSKNNRSLLREPIRILRYKLQKRKKRQTWDTLF